jgi:hypothetical protein
MSQTDPGIDAVSTRTAKWPQTRARRMDFTYGTQRTKSHCIQVESDLPCGYAGKCVRASLAGFKLAKSRHPPSDA